MLNMKTVAGLINKYGKLRIYFEENFDIENITDKFGKRMISKYPMKFHEERITRKYAEYTSVSVLYEEDRISIDIPVEYFKDLLPYNNISQVSLYIDDKEFATMSNKWLDCVNNELLIDTSLDSINWELIGVDKTYE